MRRFLVLTMILSTLVFAANGQVNVQLLHQLVSESKSEHSRQTEARNKQAVTSAGEEVNRVQMQKLKDKYRELKNRFHTVGLAINAAQIAIEATPIVDQILAHQQSIFRQAQNNPLLIPLALQTQVDIADRSRMLANYIVGLSLSVGDLGQMKSSDRKLLFGHALEELRKIEGASRGLAMAMAQRSTRGSPSFPDMIAADRRKVEEIIRKVHVLKNY